MLTLVLLAALGSADPSQDQARRPVPPTGAYERTLPLADLLAEVPDDAWGPYPNRWTLTPATLELRRRAESGELSDDEWRTALIRADTIHTRKRWPAGQPLVLWVDQQAWLRMTEIRVRAVQPDLGEVSANNLPPGGGVVGVCGNDIDERKSKNRHLRLAELPPGTKRVRFEVSILQGDAAVKGSNPRPAPKQLWHGFLELPIEAVPTAEEILLPTTEGSDAIRKALVAGLLKNTDDPPPAEPEEGLAFVVRGDYDDYPVLRGTGLSLSLELWHEGRSLCVTNLVADQGDIWNSDRSKGFRGQAILSHTPEDLLKSDADFSTWTVRVRGDPREAISVWEADRWWNGDFSVPLSDLMSK